MSPKYHVYIDEAGDPGVKPKDNEDPHWTDWFAIGCLVVSDQRDSDVIDWVRDMQEATRSWGSDGIHYRNLSPANQARVCRMLGRKPARIFVVLSHKTSMRKHYNSRLGRANDKIFYNWCLRLLLERVTEWCYWRSQTENADECAARFVFSERGGHNYEEMRDYFKKLQAQTLTKKLILNEKGIVPGVLSDNRIEICGHSHLAGLQLADVAVSAHFNAANSMAAKFSLEPARALKNIVARYPNRNSADLGLLRLPFAHQGSIPEQDRAIFAEHGYVF